MNATRKTLNGPGGIKVVLDRNEIIPHDPGAGCPALVVVGRYSASWSCAINEGELECGEYTLTAEQVAWLDSVAGEVWQFLA